MLPRLPGVLIFLNILSPFYSLFGIKSFPIGILVAQALFALTLGALL